MWIEWSVFAKVLISIEFITSKTTSVKETNFLAADFWSFFWEKETIEISICGMIWKWSAHFFQILSVSWFSPVANPFVMRIVGYQNLSGSAIISQYGW